MLFNLFLILVLVPGYVNAGSMESVFKGSKPAVEEATEPVVEKTTEPVVENTTEKKDTETKSASNVFKPVKIEKQKYEETTPGATSVFGRKQSSTYGNEHPNDSKATNVFIGNRAEEDKQVVEVKEDELEGNYSGKDFLWPVEKGQVSSYYGWRSSKRFHDGIDISALTGTKIFAVKDGKVVYSGKKIRGYGNMIVIKHIGKIYSVYAHNSVNKVSTGDTVNKGDVIGLVGNTGRSHGPHVHFEVRQGKYSVDPLKYFNYLEDKKGNRKYGFVHEFK
ncbi:MAG: M23 family metallopeptidase [Proteobacteria bacterium]|nr:M23 family metallopeptidase [Pseudomonadota bacterium]